eukprot:TRINITY_DN7273_c0_g1_i1.p1 TRINITY_DN7273_c0_g1~~TRINITY_DN7273_c0_g1_i1.p1  ORF type:complete len:140 (-),score=6.03 TRINITY_DN7273_c0_g1_i1:361-780(-)
MLYRYFVFILLLFTTVSHSRVIQSHLCALSNYTNQCEDSSYCCPDDTECILDVLTYICCEYGACGSDCLLSEDAVCCDIHEEVCLDGEVCCFEGGCVESCDVGLGDMLWAIIAGAVCMVIAICFLIWFIFNWSNGVNKS